MSLSDKTEPNAIMAVPGDPYLMAQKTSPSVRCRQKPWCWKLRGEGFILAAAGPLPSPSIP